MKTAVVVFYFGKKNMGKFAMPGWVWGGLSRCVLGPRREEINYRLTPEQLTAQSTIGQPPLNRLGGPRWARNGVWSVARKWRRGTDNSL